MMDREFQRKPFIISKAALEQTEDWFENSKPLSAAHFYYDDKTEIVTYDYEGISLILVGYILDIEDGTKSAEEILAELCQLYKHEEKTPFHEKLDLLNGRYILLADDGRDTRLYTDATCMRPVFYWNNEIFGSHEALVRSVVNAEKEIELARKKYGMNGFLDYTSTEDVFKMNPNLYYSAGATAFTRYYPREEAMLLTTDEVVANTISHFKPQVEWLALNYDSIYQSLTGGYDSKVSMAITKPIMDKIEYFTYMIDLENTPDSQFSRIYRKDKDLVDRLVYNLNLRHKYYFFNEYTIPKEYESKIGRNVSSFHSYVLSYLTYKEFRKGQIHVKSTIYEIAKLPFNKEDDYAEDKETLLRVAARWAPKPLKSDSEAIESMYDAFCERNDFGEVADRGYNLPIMLYWEARMANWHGNITQETDNVVETFVFVNNRHMLNQFLFLDTEAKEKRSYFEKVIAEFWPILNYFVPNSYETLEDRVKKKESQKPSSATHKIQLNHQGLEVTEMKNIDVVSSTGELEISPLAGVNLKDEQISISLKNESGTDVEVVITGYYEHPQKNIFIKINDDKRSINEFIEGRPISIPRGEHLTLSYEYVKNFDRSSWYRAGKLNIR
ncbi:hypothetical protein K6L05_00885 [Salinicoccus roseus]|uniref:hypothetical protein n=1 Tax=Salinicoccus roseus TaxID=45670 RepID=UPI001CA6E4E8|nr:hypothetical protein [Salinicoccus roseus]MBY8908339.1 hypothetical protein [Salinicoccus roseus]